MAITYCFCSWHGEADDYEKHMKDAHGGQAEAEAAASEPEKEPESGRKASAKE